MKNDEWPIEYQKQVNLAIGLSQDEGIEVALGALRSVEDRFRLDPAFAGRFEDLQKSILSNIILVLTLSDEANARLALELLEKDGSSLSVFPSDEQVELRRTIKGKLTSTNWKS